MSHSIKPGDWVMSYSPGIWQVYRVLLYKTAEPATGKEITQTMVFSKRFISKSGKVSFKEECCALSLVEPIHLDALDELESFIAKNPDSVKRFNNYTPKSIDMVYNARISLPKGVSAIDFERSIPKEKLLKQSEIEILLKKLAVWNVSGFQTAQFVSPNFTCRNRYLAFAFSRLLNF